MCTGGCGVLATNPGLLKSIGKRVAKAAIGEIPGASLVMEGLGLASDVAKSGKEKETVSSSPKSHSHRWNWAKWAVTGKGY